MTDRAPRSFSDALAGAMGVSPGYAQQYKKRLGGDTPVTQAIDAELQAEAASAETEAWRSIEEIDIEDAIASDDPEVELREMVASRSERELRARLAAHASWANTDDRTARTRKAREAFEKRFEHQVDPDGVLDPVERRKRAGHARKAYFLSMALKSAQARRSRKP